MAVAHQEQHSVSERLGSSGVGFETQHSSETVLVAPGHVQKWKHSRLPLQTIFPKETAQRVKGLGFTFRKQQVLEDAQVLAKAQRMLLKVYEEHSTGDATSLDFVTPVNMHAKKQLCRAEAEAASLFGGSRDVVSKAICTSIRVISIYKYRYFI